MQNLVLESLANTDVSYCEPPKELAAEAGGVSLHESGFNWNERTNNEEIFNHEATRQSLPGMNSKGRSCEGFSESTFSTSEPSGSWGDFEAFKEPLDKSEGFSHDDPEVLVKSAKPRGADPDLGRGGCSVSAAHGAGPSPCQGMQDEVRVYTKPRATNVCVAASCTSRFVSVHSAEGNAAAPAEKLSSYFSATSSGKKSNFFTVFDKYLSCPAGEL